ncbi:tandem-95 repeat protein, partial [Psychromonas marina]|uniref:tandem-95 repeat protein n=1 Tax=Psychromonas marina TaxID=88364 RepID=UPI0024E18575
NDDGSFTITPDADFNGDLDLSFDVSDGTTTVAAGVDLTVNPINDAAVAPDVSFEMDEDGVITITDEQLLANATDIDGDDLSVDGVTYTGTDGVLTSNGDGTHTFSPNENFNGDVQLDFGVSDGTVTTPANIDIAVADVNDAPVAGSTSYTVNEDGQITISPDQLLANSSDVDGTVSLDSVSYSGSDGVLITNQDGSVTFSPNENFNGEISLDVVVIDDDGATAETTAGISAIAVNDSPVVDGNVAYSVDEDGTITLSQEQLLANATDVDGDDLTAVDLSVGGNATVVANDDGSFTITPDADFNGDLDLSFDVSDGTTTVAAGVDLTVNPINDAAVAPDVSFEMNEDGIIVITDEQLLANATDIDNDELSVDGVSYSGTDGVLTDNGDGTHSFAPNENFNGDVQLDFGVSDGTVTTPANIDIAVADVNDAPVAGSTSYTVNEDGQITISPDQLLANSSDVDGTVSLDSVSYSGSDGVLITNEDGSVTFSPNENFNGEISLDVVVIDDDGATAETTAGISAIAVNDAPVVDGNVAYSVDEDGTITLSQEQLLANATDVDGDDLTAVDLSVGGNATVVANDDGSFTITPDADFNGDLDLSFDVSDGTTTVAAGVDLTVNPINDAAVAPDVSFEMNEDGIIVITDEQLLANATDIDNDELSVDGVSYSGTDGVLTDNGDGTHSFAPNENFNGDVQLDFGVSDGTVTTPANIDIAVADVNDAPVAGSTSYTVNEDGQITISPEQLLANSSDVDGTVSLDSVSYSGSDGILTNNSDGSVTFFPNENFNGEISLDVTVIDDDGATAETTAGITALAVNDTPIVDGNLAYSMDEDGTITLSQEQLLAYASDIDGDALSAENLSVGDNATIVQNPDGSFTVTPDADFNGDLDLSFDVSDGTTTIATGVDLKVNPVNDAPIAGPEIYIQAEEDQTVGVTLREEPAIRLDAQPEFGIVQANIDDEWVTLEVGQEISPDAEVRFVPDETAIADSTHTSTIGTFDDNASVDDWGTEVDSHTRQFTDGDLVVTTESTDGPLGAWNGNTHIGHGIGDTDRQGLSGDEQLVVTVEGQDVNEISFELDGLGGWFVEGSKNFTEVEIRAFDADGNLIDSETYHKDDNSSFEHSYTLTTDEPVARFELGTVEGNGTYVVQNMSVSQTLPDDVVFTSIAVDGSEVTETIDLNLHAGDQEIDLSEQLPLVLSAEDGAEGFASIVITEAQLLAQASDIDSENLDIINLELNDENAELVDNGDGTWTVIPDENFSGDIDLTYQVTDGELVDDNTIHINFAEVNDAPIASGPVVLSTEEDNSISFTDADLLANASDIEGDDLAIQDVSYTGNAGELITNEDGSYTFVPNENFNGDVDLTYGISDGEDVTTNNIDLTVIPVNDVPVAGAPLDVQMLNDGTITINASSLLSGASDVDGDILHIEDLVLTNQLDGTLVDNGDNTFSFTPAEGFTGNVSLSFDISDGQASAPSSLNITVEEFNEGPEVSGPLAATIEEDGSITLSQEELLANASDLDGDSLAATNLATNDENATIIQNSDGSFTITPSEDFNGDIEFSYDVTDGIETVATELELTVTPVNDAPDVPDLSFNMIEDESITVTTEQLLAQATDVEGDELSVVNVSSQDPNVEVVDNGDGTYTITPQPEYSGTAGLSFDVSDGTDVVSADINLNIEFVNDAPEAEPIVASVDEDGTILVTQEMLLENASDNDGDLLRADSLQTNDPNATVVDNGDGTFSVTPSENFNGDITFSYDVSDGETDTPTELTLTVNPINDGPDVAPVNFEIQEDETLIFTEAQLLAQATDVEGDELSITDVSYSGDQGALTNNNDGTYTFTPTENFSGNIAVDFSVTDGTDEVSQTIDVAIEAVADAPELTVTTGDGDVVTDEAIVVEPGSTTQLNIDASLIDQDLSETLTLEVDGLPEGSVLTYDGEALFDEQTNGITSYESTDITVTFQGESAGYQNTAGYYTVDEEGNITGVEIGFENASQVGSGGDLVAGESSFTFDVDAGESFNLFVIPNGNNRNDFDSMQEGTFEFRDADGNPATIDSVDPHLVHISEDGTETPIVSQFGDAIFHGGNSTNLNEDGIEHTKTSLNEDGDIVYGVEDIFGGGDQDFDDFTFTIDVGETNSQIFQGEIVVGEDGSAIIPTTVLDQNLAITFPEDYTGSTSLEIKATATELSNDDQSSTVQVINFEVDHAPESDAVTAQVDEDGSITITQADLLANATDLDGDDLVALNVTSDDENVTLVDNGDGTYTVTPDADFNGDVSFSFDVSDGDQIVSTELNLTVNPINDAALAPDVAFEMDEDGIIVITDEQLLAGATDIEGDNLSIDSVTYTGADGVLTNNGDGTHSFAPNENFNGDVQLDFGVSDGTDVTPANIDIAVADVNDAPVAGSTSYTVNEDGQITISSEQLIANSSDVDGTVSLDSVSYSGTDGILVQNNDGSVTFSPNENFNGDISLDISVIDDDGAVAQTTAGIEVIAVNDAPVAGDLAYSVDEDGSVTLSQEQLLANSSDVDGDDLVAGNLSGGNNVTVTENGDGSFTLTPDANFHGEMDISFDVTDGEETVQANIDLTINPINDITVGVEDQAFTVEEDGTLTFTDEQLLTGATDIDGDELSVSNVDYSGTEGVFTDNGDGTYSFAPNENFNGEVDLSFSVTDGNETVGANIDVTVTDINDIPVAGSTTYTVNEDGQITISPEQLLANSSDVDGTVSVDSVAYSGSDGVLITNEDGSVTFSPNENFNGEISLDVVVIDDDGATAETTAGITAIAVNDAPVVDGSIAYSVDEDGTITLSQEQLLANASDVEGDDLTAVDLSVGGNATVVANDDGSFTITPDTDFNGDLDLSFDVSDGTTTVAAGVDLTVNPVNDAAVAPDVSFEMDEDGVIVITDAQLLANATDVDGDDLSVDGVSYSGADGVLTDNGNGTYDFAPNENFNGDVQLDFGVSDGTVTTPANIDIAVADVNDAPVAGSTSYTVNEDGQITISPEQLLANSSDVDGTVSLDSVSYSGSDGVLITNEDGSVTFSPNENFNGEISLDVVVIDDDGATAETTAGISALAVNDAPVVDGNVAYSVDEDGTITLSQEQLLANASDVDGDALTAENLSVGDNATVVQNPDGSFTVTPDADFNGDLDLSFDVSDGTTTVATGVDLTVNPVNDAAVAPDVAFEMNEDGIITITDEQLLANATDVDGDNLSVDGVSYSGTDGVLTSNGDGTHSFAPNENFNGDVQLDFGVSDGTVTTPANIDITVAEVNDVPVAGSTSYQMNEDGSITLSPNQLLANASDIEGEVALDSVSYSGTDGVLVNNPDGSVTFSPNENFNGDINLDVAVVDEAGAVTVGNAGIEVLAVNDLPIAGETSYTIDEDSVLIFNESQILANASD